MKKGGTLTTRTPPAAPHVRTSGRNTKETIQQREKGHRHKDVRAGRWALCNNRQTPREPCATKPWHKAADPSVPAETVILGGCRGVDEFVAGFIRKDITSFIRDDPSSKNCVYIWTKPGRENVGVKTPVLEIT